MSGLLSGLFDPASDGDAGGDLDLSQDGDLTFGVEAEHRSRDEDQDGSVRERSDSVSVDGELSVSSVTDVGTETASLG